MRVLLVMWILGAAQMAMADIVMPMEQGGMAENKKPGLKYKRGPTCMCAHGTSEEDIRKAEEIRRSAETLQLKDKDRVPAAIDQ